MTTINKKTTFCKVQRACDGAALTTASRIEKGVCLKCEEAAEKRKKVVEPRGINSALPASLRP